jgi:hypothetical protein
LKRRVTYLIAATVTAFSLIGGGAVAATQHSATPPPVSTPIGVQPDGRVAGCVKSSAGTGPAVLSVRRTTGTCGKGFKTVYWNQKGATGAKGVQGVQGPKGDTGAAAPAAVYGVAKVDIKRGAGNYGTWATASTSVGSPVGDNASNTFRMTCSSSNAPCFIKARAYATGDNVKVYPRLLIQKSSIDTGAPVGQCEYADGANNDGATQNLTGDAADLTLGIGGSLDCGSDQVRPADGVVDEIKVPAGYYDIAATFVFTK